MELYDADKLFVGYIGVVYYNAFYDRKIEKNELIITKKIFSDSDLYHNIFSDEKYKVFSQFASKGESCIITPQSLTSFITKKYNNNNKLKNLPTIKKIFNGESLNKTELKKLLIALNSNNFYITLKNVSEDIIDKKKSDIKLNYITNLTNKKYKLQPTIGRDIEIKQTITSLIQNNKGTLLVGERGVGKTSIVDEISYRISKKEIPNFFKNKKIIELNFNTLNISIDSIEENIIDIIELAKKDNLIIFIDGLENINNTNILRTLKYEIERNDLKVIATINSNNIIKIFNDDIFNKVIINEPDFENLSKIINKVFNDYSIINNIKLLDEEIMTNLIVALIDFTAIENRIITDCSTQPINYDIHNPGLIIEIINAIFADAIVNNNKQLTIENILFGINFCNKIKENVKNNFSKELKTSLNIIHTYKELKKLC